MNNNKKALTGEQKAQIENNRLAALERKRVRENKRLEAESLKAAKQKKKVPISQATAQIKIKKIISSFFFDKISKKMVRLIFKYRRKKDRFLSKSEGDHIFHVKS